MPEEMQYGLAKGYSADEIHRLFKLALISLGEIVILDDRGRVAYISKSYADNMGVSIQQSLGQPITEIIDDSKLPEVLRTGKPIMGAIYYRNGNAFWVNRIPLRDGNETIGVVGQSILTSDLVDNQLKKKLDRVIRELNYYKEKYERTATPHFDIASIVAQSKIMNQLKETLSNVANTRSTVLITGESGTGKEVFANALHSLSSRRNKPFARLNCAAIPDNLLESELFGYEEGAFTGALRGGKIGDFEAANGGTVFLDEIDSLSPNMQAKLLRVLQEREIKKVGSTKSIPIDVRFVFATNKDLVKLIQEGSFREDFYYRINVINLHIPPLRERPEDIVPLVQSFIQKFNRELDMSISGVEPAALLLLESYSWPGNIRELENCIERAFNYAETSVIQLEDIRLPGIGRDADKLRPRMPGVTLKEVRARAERVAIQRALEVSKGNRTEAAKLLGIDRSILYDKMRRYHLP